MLYKQTEWKSNERWHCNCVDNLAGGSGYWWHPARIMGISPAEFLKWLLSQDFKPDFVCHNEDCSFVGWSWKSQAQMRKYKNYINKLAREKNYQI